MDRLVSRTLEQRRALQIVAGLIGLGSLLMVAVSVWGLTHGTVRQRWQEFGIRLALGAAAGHVGRLALRDAWLVALAGAGGGLVLAWQFGRVLQRWLFGVSPAEPSLRADPASLLRDV